MLMRRAVTVAVHISSRRYFGKPTENADTALCQGVIVQLYVRSKGEVLERQEELRQNRQYSSR